MNRHAGTCLVLLSVLALAPAIAREPESAPMVGARMPPAGLEQQDMTPEQQRILSDANKRRIAAEKIMYTIRREHFGEHTVIAQRKAGIDQLRQFTDPATFPSLLTIFRNEAADVREAVLDHLAAQGTAAGDTVLAWAVVNEKDEAFRAEASKRLEARVAAAGQVPGGVKSIIADGLDIKDPNTNTRAGTLAHTFNLIEAIPMMINAQVQLPTTTSTSIGDNGSASIGYILIGTQRAFVSGLTPVVGNSAVGFDPQLSVITEGAVLSINDASVTTYYNVSLHRQLVAFTSQASGRDTAGLGWDQRAWAAWYTNEFVPQLAAKTGGDTALPPGH